MDEDGVVHVSLYAKKGDNVLTETITHGNMTVPGTFGMNLQFFAEEDIKNQSSTSLKKAIRKYEKRIAEHKEKISNPESVVPGWNENSEARKKGTIRHWEKEIRNFNNNINDRIEELKKRGDLDD